MGPDVEITDRRRLIARLAGDYHVNTARRSARFISRDIVTALTILAINRANVRELLASREVISDPHEGIAGVPTDDRRRPVSVYAVAKDLGLPYETIRRRARQLVAAGVCAEVDGGLIIPAKVLTAPAHDGIIAETWAATTEFVQEAGRLGVAAGPPGAAGPDVLRQTLRLTTDFFLESTCHSARIMDLDVLTVLALRAVNKANIAHVTHDPELARAHAGLAQVVPDAQRRPVSVYAIGKFLLLPYETARRAAKRLEDRGLVERGPDGLTTPTEVLARPEVIRAMIDMAALTEAFLADLSAIGVGYRPEAA